MKKSKSAWIIILAVCIIVVLVCAWFLLRYFFGQENSPSRAVLSPTAPDAPSLSETSFFEEESLEPATEEETVNTFGYEIAETPDVTTLSFDELMEINPDIYAWIYIPGTNVDYPVAQSIADGDDTFYLSHNIYRQYQFSGTIYSEIQNSPAFDDPVTVLYGHNMLNGSMFATLHYFEDEDFFRENNTIFIFTKDRLLTYLIYSAYTYDDRHILNSFVMSDDVSHQEYIDSTLEPRSYNMNIREGVDVNLDSKILTLSTCSNGSNGTTRYLVQGVLVNDEPRT